jgi:hypothetical protein
MRWETVTFAAVLLQILMTTSTHSAIEEAVSYDIRESNIRVDYRLPTNVRPINYNITLNPLIEEPVPSTFTGEVIIRVKVLEETGSITLHYNNLTIDGVNITEASTGIVLPVNDTYDNVTHFWVIRAGATAEGTFKTNAEYLIAVNYTGHHLDDMFGFYRSSYRTENKTV